MNHLNAAISNYYNELKGISEQKSPEFYEKKVSETTKRLIRENKTEELVCFLFNIQLNECGNLNGTDETLQPFKAKVITAVDELLRTRAGRRVLGKIAAIVERKSMEPEEDDSRVCIASGEKSSTLKQREGVQILDSERFDVFSYNPVVDKHGDVFLEKQSFSLDLAHELIHFIHRRQNYYKTTSPPLPKGVANPKENPFDKTLVHEDFHSTEEQRTISGIKPKSLKDYKKRIARNPESIDPLAIQGYTLKKTNENALRVELGLKIRPDHMGEYMYGREANLYDFLYYSALGSLKEIYGKNPELLNESLNFILEEPEGKYVKIECRYEGTPLGLAVYMGNKEAVKLFLKMGANPYIDISNFKDISPEIMKLLQKHQGRRVDLLPTEGKPVCRMTTLRKKTI